MKPDDLSDEQILLLVGITDKELFDAGLNVKQRSWEVPIAVMKKFGYSEFAVAGVGIPNILRRIRSSFASIYRKEDVAMGGHIGVFMYRDIFARIEVPHVYGEVCINPLECVQLTQVQRKVIQTERDQIEAYLDQFFDVADVQYGTEELRQPFATMELVKRYIGLSRLHLHAASAILTGGFDHRGAVQAALLATELALKAGTAALGSPEEEIRKTFGHRNDEIAEFVGKNWPLFDLDRVKRVIADQPSYVRNRYSPTQPDRRDVGHLVMGAQYVVSEIVRQMSDRDSRSGVTSPFARRYPP